MKKAKTIAVVATLICAALSTFFWQAASRPIASHYRIDPARQRIVRIDNPDQISLLPEFLRPKPILLTIDDGPSNTAVDLRMLAVLKKHHAHAIWFISCKTLDPAINPAAEEHRQVLRKILADGNILGNHGYHHYNLKDLDLQGSPLLAPEISGCSRLIESVAGVRPKYFRPPWGKTTRRVYGIVRSEGMQTVLWTYDSHDWMLSHQSQPAMFLNYVHGNPEYDIANQRGGIVLMHDFPRSDEMLDELLTSLEESNFVFVLPG